jgi:uncharacterized protein (DUF779 family)
MSSVTATPAARDLIEQLRQEHGPLSFHVSGSYGVTVICLKARDLNIGARDIQFGVVEGAPVFVMTSEIARWQGRGMIIDIAKGVGVGFSIEGASGLHFTLRSRAGSRHWDANAILAAGPPPSAKSKDSPQ